MERIIATTAGRSARLEKDDAMDPIWKIHQEVLSLIEGAKKISGEICGLTDSCSLADVSALLARVDGAEWQPEFHRYFPQAALRIAGESPSFVSYHALMLRDVRDFLSSIDGCDKPSEAGECANLAGVVGASTHELDEYLTELRREAAIAAEILREATAATAPLTEMERMEDFCLNLFLEGKTLKEIDVALKNDSEFASHHFTNERAVRGPIQRAAKRRNIKLKSRQPGRPKGSRNRRKAP